MNDLSALLASEGSSGTIDVDGRTIRLTSLDRIYWPSTRTRKRELLAYYVSVADPLLAHIRHRPLTLGRYPEGVEGPNWFQTRCPHPPEWMTTHPIGPQGGRSTREYCVVDDLPGLLWAVNLGSVELHPLLSRSSTFGCPDAVVFDLDPGPPADLVACCAAALVLRTHLDSSGLASYPKTSGAMGLHVFVPVKAETTYRTTKRFAKALALELEREHPDLLLARPNREERAGKVFVDWSQNDQNKSIVAPYSLRALPWPVASTPLRWDEVEEAASSGSLDSLPLSADATRERVEVHGDLFAGVLVSEQALPAPGT